MKNLKSFEKFNESEKWIQDAIKKPGSLRKSLKKKKDEKITTSEINDEISKLKEKDKDPSKKGVQGLSKRDLDKFKKLNLAKTLKSMNESIDLDEDYILDKLDELDEYTILELIDNLSDKYPHIDLEHWEEIKDDYNSYSDDDEDTDWDDSYAADAADLYWKTLSSVPFYFINEPGAKEIIISYLSSNQTNESTNTDNYMFFQNLNTMKKQIEEMLLLPEDEVDNILRNGHAWAVDHICTSKDDIGEVYEFLSNQVKK
jgi:hypothetical protein